MTTRIIPNVEVSRHEFHCFPDYYSRYVRECKQGGTDAPAPKAFYDNLYIKEDPNDPPRSLEACDIRMVAESQLYDHGRVYYKIWPRLLEHLATCEINIDGRYFEMPFSSFEVRFPRDENVFDPIESLVVFRCTKPSTSETFVGVVIAGLLANPCAFVFSIRDGELLRESVASIDRRVTEGWEQGVTTSVARVAICVALFGVNRHELVLPDIPRRVIEFYQRERRDPTEREALNHLAESRRNGHFGFKLGSEIDVPRPIYRSSDDRRSADGAGDRRFQFQFGHIRSSHMHWYAVGKGRQRREPRFIMPTHVRPDLPLSSHGFRIGRHVGVS